MESKNKLTIICCDIGLEKKYFGGARKRRGMIGIRQYHQFIGPVNRSIATCAAIEVRQVRAQLHSRSSDWPEFLAPYPDVPGFTPGSSRILCEAVGQERDNYYATDVVNHSQFDAIKLLLYKTSLNGCVDVL
ncbi:unnamed protein product [Timema podura]|uniref:Uncharacterized protein n=1 Tax=Timema podura TaxID=61482 RepID=A0ABN7NCK4_TIMPD|nr:unnamed protein product [Timema podura]